MVNEEKSLYSLDKYVRNITVFIKCCEWFYGDFFIRAFSRKKYKKVQIISQKTPQKIRMM